MIISKRPTLRPTLGGSQNMRISVIPDYCINVAKCDKLIMWGVDLLGRRLKLEKPVKHGETRETHHERRR